MGGQYNLREATMEAKRTIRRHLIVGLSMAKDGLILKSGLILIGHPSVY